MSKYRFESKKELLDFIDAELINTAEVTRILDCTRQNVFDLIKRGKLTPVKEMPRDRLFLKEDVLERLKPS